ncbi:MAG: efflux transporter outer membrane subunit [Methylococcaceae bacterium]|jgi:NodT family efflux transporter outer membrane factor (OMF) lipoprotein
MRTKRILASFRPISLGCKNALKLKLAVLSSSFLLILSSCTVGPDFTRPDSPKADNLTNAQQTKQIAADSASAKGQALLINQDIPGQWWQLFQSPSLNELVIQAYKRNVSLQSALAALTAAREDRLAKAGELFPKLDASFATTQQKVSGAQFGNPNFGGSVFTLYNASVKVSYTLDVFGGIQRQIEGLEAQAEYERFQLEGAVLTLTANIVTTAIQEASLRKQIAATEVIIQAYSDQLNIIKQQFDIGSLSKIEVLSQQTLLEQTRSTLPPLQKQLAQLRHQLSVLVGDVPEGTALLAKFSLDDLHLPEQLPLSLPAKLVQQRPDIRAQEAQLHAASAKIGVITASAFPDFTISANISSIATLAGNLFAPGTGVWSVGGTLLQPLFRGGQLTHQKRAAVALYEQAQAEYHNTVLNALQNVADTLSALEFDNAELQAQDAATQTALANLELVRNQLQIGAASHLELLNAERAYQQSRISQVKVEALRYADTAALFQSLGGGWWNRDDASKAISNLQNINKKPVSLFEMPRLRK